MTGTTQAHHIGDEYLIAYLESKLKTDETADIRKHLVKCDDCFKRLAILKKAVEQGKEQPSEKTPPELIRRAKNLVPAEAPHPVGEKTIPPSKNAIVDTLRYKAGKLFAPVPKWWYALALGMFALFIILVSRPSPVTNISMGDRLTISKDSPLGFVREQEITPYEGMKVSLSDDKDTLIFTWPEVDGALYYDVFLYHENEEKRLTPMSGIRATSFNVPRIEIHDGKCYIWAVIGRMQSGEYFVARAKFLVRDP